MTIRLGQKAPPVDGASVVGNGSGGFEFSTFSLADVNAAGKWAVLYFYPLDFTFV